MIGQALRCSHALRFVKMPETGLADDDLLLSTTPGVRGSWLSSERPSVEPHVDSAGFIECCSDDALISMLYLGCEHAQAVLYYMHVFQVW